MKPGCRARSHPAGLRRPGPPASCLLSPSHSCCVTSWASWCASPSGCSSPSRCRWRDAASAAAAAAGAAGAACPRSRAGGCAADAGCCTALCCWCRRSCCECRGGREGLAWKLPSLRERLRRGGTKERKRWRRGAGPWARALPSSLAAGLRVPRSPRSRRSGVGRGARPLHVLSGPSSGCSAVRPAPAFGGSRRERRCSSC